MQIQAISTATHGAPYTFLSEERQLILAASLGTVFEWYDFYLYGSLALTISKQFFSGVDENTAFLFALLAFAAGFIVRPFGAVFFGRLGDLIGRKYTFLSTMLIMGIATMSVGILPGYSRLGVAAPVLLVTLRLLQGLAVGGEFGGAAVYVAEQSGAATRGYRTSWIQATPTIGLLLSLVVVLLCRLITGPAFEVWGWRLPFFFSFVMLLLSLWIRISMKESKVYLHAKLQGKLSRAPLREIFNSVANLRKLLVAFGGMVCGGTVVWYTGHFYVLYFLIQSLRVDPMNANLLLGAALILGSPFFILFGRLSDRIGRRPVMLTGMLAAAFVLFPVFRGLAHYVNPQLADAVRRNPVVVSVDPRTCGFQFDPLGQRKNSSDCDKARALLSRIGVPYSSRRSQPAGSLQITIGNNTLTGFDAEIIRKSLKAAGYPEHADPAEMNLAMVIALLTALVLLAAIIFGPMAAALVELFPTRIRYTALSIPFQAGVGWIGGLLPTVAFSLVVTTGNIYSGLWYPSVIAFSSFFVGLLLKWGDQGRDLIED